MKNLFSYSFYMLNKSPFYTPSNRGKESSLRLYEKRKSISEKVSRKQEKEHRNSIVGKLQNEFGMLLGWFKGDAKKKQKSARTSTKTAAPNVYSETTETKTEVRKKATNAVEKSQELFRHIDNKYPKVSANAEQKKEMSEIRAKFCQKSVAENDLNSLVELHGIKKKAANGVHNLNLFKDQWNGRNTEEIQENVGNALKYTTVVGAGNQQEKKASRKMLAKAQKVYYERKNNTVERREQIKQSVLAATDNPQTRRELFVAQALEDIENMKLIYAHKGEVHVKLKNPHDFASYVMKTYGLDQNNSTEMLKNACNETVDSILGGLVGDNADRYVGEVKRHVIDNNILPLATKLLDVAQKSDTKEEKALQGVIAYKFAKAIQSLESVVSKKRDAYIKSDNGNNLVFGSKKA